MQVNVWQGHLLNSLLKLIDQENPDVIFTQEVFTYPEHISPYSPWKQFRTLELISTQNHFNHVFFSPCCSFNVFGHQLSYGNAIFSKHRFNHTSTHYTGGPGPLHLDNPASLESFDSNLTRNFQHVSITSHGTTLNLINHHGHWVNQPRGNEASAERLQEVASYIKALEGPVIVGGDFNLSPGSPAIQAFQQTTDLYNLVSATGATTTLSSAHYVQGIICDYLFASPNLKVRHIEVNDQLVSDHKAVIARIDC